MAAALALAGCGPFGSSHSNATPARYLLVLGDSLSTGYQPGSTGDRLCRNGAADATGRGGWACLLLGRLRASGGGPYDIANLAVNGEDTCGYLTGRTCGGRPIGDATPQQQEASAFLRSHAGRVAAITLDIGADDAGVLARDEAQGPTAQGYADLNTAFARATRNYRRILQRLRDAAPGVPILALGYYVPNLPASIPPTFLPLADGLIQSLAIRFNRGIVAAASAAHASYVDLYHPFLGKRGSLLVPGDIHPDDRGQQLIARLVWKAYHTH